MFVLFWQRHALRLAACFAPTLAAIPSSATSARRQYRDPERREECEVDELTYKGKLRLASASTCLELAARTCVLEAINIYHTIALMSTSTRSSYT